MFNWFKRNKEEAPTEPLYTNKGVYKSESKTNPWRAQLGLKRVNRFGKQETFTVHIGVYKSFEEAQKARWEFIESLK